MDFSDVLAWAGIIVGVVWLRGRLDPVDMQYRQARDTLASLLERLPVAKGLEKKYIERELAKLKKKYPYIDPPDDTPIGLQFAFDDQHNQMAGSGITWVKVKKARKPIQRWLKRREGGTCLLRVGEVMRLLMHNPALDGLVVHYTEHVGEREIASCQFARHQLTTAIEHFLRDALLEEGVQLMPS